MDVERFWDDAAADYDTFPDHGLLDPDARAAWKDLLRTWLPSRPSRIADLACGTGTMSALAAELGHEVVGIDLSSEMVLRARQKLAPFGAACTVAKGDASDPDLPAGSVDVVLARHILWTLPNPSESLSRWARLLRPGGRMVLIEGRWGGHEDVSRPDGETGSDARMPWEAGVASPDLRAAVEPLAGSVTVVPLWDRVYWGKDIDHERYLLCADGVNAPQDREMSGKAG